MSLLVPVGKCMPQILAEVVKHCRLMLEPRRPTTILDLYGNDIVSPPHTGLTMRRFLNNGAAPELVSAALPLSDESTIAEWALDVLVCVERLRQHRRHVLVVGPYYSPSSTSIYNRTAEIGADAVIALGAAEDYELFGKPISDLLAKPSSRAIWYGDRPPDVSPSIFQVQYLEPPSDGDYHYGCALERPLDVGLAMRDEDWRD